MPLKKHIVLPAAPLRPFVSHYDLIEVAPGQLPALVPPQLSSGFSFCKFEGGHFNTYNERLKHDVVPASFIIPVHSQAYTIEVPGAGWALGVHFYPGKFHDFFGWPQDLFPEDETVQPGETDYRKAFLELEEKVFEARSPAEIFARIDSFLLGHFYRASAFCPVIDYAIKLIRRSGGAISMRELMDGTCLSERHFRRLFREHTGLPAHSFLRIYRFYQVFWRLQSGHFLSLTKLAHDVGYFDQAHFIRDFRFFTGQSPREFLQRHDALTEQVAWDVEEHEG